MRYVITITLPDAELSEAIDVGKPVGRAIQDLYWAVRNHEAFISPEESWSEEAGNIVKRWAPEYPKKEAEQS